MLLVTGASGHVGSAALRHLAAAAGPQAVAGLARNAERAARAVPGGVALRIAGYEDRHSLDRAFDGVTRLLFVASDGAGADVVRQHANVLAAAAASGIEHIVFTSIVDIDEASPFYFTPVYRDAERRLVECGKDWTILRCGIYSDFLWSNWLAPARASGVISVPAAQGRIAPVSRDDVAAAAAAVLLSGAHRGAVHELTGPAALSFDDMAELAARAWRSSVVYRPCAPAVYLLRCWETMADPWPHAFSTLFASIAQGRYAHTSAAVRQLAGRAPEDLGRFLARQA